MIRTSPLLAALALAGLLAAGCGSSGPAPAATASSATAAAAPAYADPACPSMLAAVATIDPAQQVTGGQLDSLRGIASPGSTLAGLASGLQSDLFAILDDQSGLTANTGADLAKYDSDVSQLRQFCAAS